MGADGGMPWMGLDDDDPPSPGGCEGSRRASALLIRSFSGSSSFPGCPGSGGGGGGEL